MKILRENKEKNSISISLARSKFNASTCETEVQRSDDTLDLASSEIGSAFQFAVNWAPVDKQVKVPTIVNSAPVTNKFS
jgi:hypothetical protein